MKTLIIMASTKKEAIEIAKQNYINPVYVKPYRYSSKGSNFYEFENTVNPPSLLRDPAITETIILQE